MGWFNGSKQRYLLFRVRRYQPAGLVQCLEQLGWKQRLLQFYGPNQSCGLLVLERV